MAAQDSTPSESQRLEVLAKQAAELERQWTELDMALRRSATVRRFLFLVVVAVLGVYIYLYISLGRGFMEPENLNLVAREVQNRALPNLDTVLAEVRKLVENTRPTVTAAFSTQFEKDMPAIKKKLEPEWKTLIENVETRLNVSVQKAYSEAVDKHQAILAEEFPTVKDPKDFRLMSDNLEGALEPLVKRFYGQRIRAQFDHLYVTWQNFPEIEGKRDRDKLADDLYHLLIALLQTKASLLGDEGERGATKSKVVPASGIVVPEAQKPEENKSSDEKPSGKE